MRHFKVHSQSTFLFASFAISSKNMQSSHLLEAEEGQKRCSVCVSSLDEDDRNRQFPNADGLWAHITTVHARWIPFECVHCPMTLLPTENVLKQHYDRSHPGKVPKAIYTYVEEKITEVRQIFIESQKLTKRERKNFKKTKTLLQNTLSSTRRRNFISCTSSSSANPQQQLLFNDSNDNNNSNISTVESNKPTQHNNTEVDKPKIILQNPKEAIDPLTLLGIQYWRQEENHANGKIMAFEEDQTVLGEEAEELYAVEQPVEVKSQSTSLTVVLPNSPKEAAPPSHHSDTSDVQTLEEANVTPRQERAEKRPSKQTMLFNFGGGSDPEKAPLAVATGSKTTTPAEQQRSLTWQCNLCGKSVKRNHTCEHIWCHHMPLKRYVCRRCDYQCNKLFLMNKHLVRRAHGQANDPSCWKDNRTEAYSEYTKIHDAAFGGTLQYRLAKGSRATLQNCSAALD